MSPWPVATTANLAEAGQSEDLFHDHRATEEAHELEREDRECRAGSVAKDVSVDDPLLGEAAASERCGHSPAGGRR